MAKTRRSIKDYEELAKDYFEGCDAANSVCEAKMPLAKPYTLSGLLCAIGLSRNGFFALEKSREGRRFVENTLMRIEAFIEENALSGRLSASAAASSLKYSFGWNEKAAEREDEGVRITLSDEVRQLGE